MDTLLDARGLACPLPAVKARVALARVPPGAALIVLATDPEALHVRRRARARLLADDAAAAYLCDGNP